MTLPRLATLLVVLLLLTAQDQKSRKIGYDNTPFLPDSKWRVHDGARPQPRVVTPGKTDREPPSDAIVLFDGTNLDAWTGKGGEAAWRIENGYMEVTRGTGSIRTKQKFSDCQLHIEWAAPAEVKGHGQGRGNSGVFLMGRYEVQVLDSFGNETYSDGQAAALYGQCPPLVNASRAPGEWQSYDILFEAPRFEAGKLVKPAFVTVLHNGVAVHHRKQLLGPTQHRRVARYAPHEPKGPIQLQDHGNPVRYRNIWIRPLGRYDDGTANVR